MYFNLTGKLMSCFSHWHFHSVFFFLSFFSPLSPCRSSNFSRRSYSESQLSSSKTSVDVVFSINHSFYFSEPKTPLCLWLVKQNWCYGLHPNHWQLATIHQKLRRWETKEMRTNETIYINKHGTLPEWWRYSGNTLSSFPWSGPGIA